MTPLDHITEALRYLETVESHGGHLGGILPDIFTVEDLRAVVEMAGEVERLRAAISWVMGEGDSGFAEPEPTPGFYQGCYWWRKELRARSALQPRDGQ